MLGEVAAAAAHLVGVLCRCARSEALGWAGVLLFKQCIRMDGSIRQGMVVACRASARRTLQWVSFPRQMRAFAAMCMGRFLSESQT